MSVTPTNTPVSTTVPTLTLAAGTTGGVAVAGSIDPVNDYLLIYTKSATATQGITRNVLLGISSQPLGLTDSQSPTNKTFNNTNSYTTKDGSLTLQNTSDATKQAKFSLANITTGNTRTYTLPDFSATFASLAGSETLTNKTLTSPTINTPTITNATINADALTGFTTSNTGTVYGVSITSGAFSGSAITAGTVGSTALATNAVQGSQLATNAITIGYASITSNFTTTTTTGDVDVTNLNVTVMVPNGSRYVRITAVCSSLLKSGTAGDNLVWKIKEGSTQLNATTVQIPGSNYSLLGWCQYISGSVTSGSHTYKVSVSQVTAGTITVTASTSILTYIHVEVS